MSSTWLRHLARGEPARRLDQPVGQGRFAVVDMGDYREIADAAKVGHCRRALAGVAQNAKARAVLSTFTSLVPGRRPGPLLPAVPLAPGPRRGPTSLLRHWNGRPRLLRLLAHLRALARRAEAPGQRQGDALGRGAARTGRATGWWRRWSPSRVASDSRNWAIGEHARQPVGDGVRPGEGGEGEGGDAGEAGVGRAEIAQGQVDPVGAAPAVLAVLIFELAGRPTRWRCAGSAAGRRRPDRGSGRRRWR